MLFLLIFSFYSPFVNDSSFIIWVLKKTNVMYEIKLCSYCIEVGGFKAPENQGLINNKTYLLNISFKLFAGRNLTF